MCVYIQVCVYVYMYIYIYIYIYLYTYTHTCEYPFLHKRRSLYTYYTYECHSLLHMLFPSSSLHATYCHLADSRNVPLRAALAAVRRPGSSQISPGGLRRRPRRSPAIALLACSPVKRVTPPPSTRQKCFLCLCIYIYVDMYKYRDGGS